MTDDLRTHWSEKFRRLGESLNAAAENIRRLTPIVQQAVETIQSEEFRVSVKKVGGPFIDLIDRFQGFKDVSPDHPARIVWDRCAVGSLSFGEAMRLLPYLPKPPRKRGRRKGSGPIVSSLDAIRAEVAKLAEADPSKNLNELLAEAQKSLGLKPIGDPKHRHDYVRGLLSSADAE